MVQHGFYIISDKFFEDFPDPCLKGNKAENRPHYYAFLDEKTGLNWFVPMSSKVGKYQRIIDARKKRGQPCDIVHIAKLDNGKVSVFDILDVFPATPEYVKREYLFNNVHLRVTSEKTAKEIDKKVKRVLKLIHNGVKLSPTQPDVLYIENKLLEK